MENEEFRKGMDRLIETAKTKKNSVEMTDIQDIFSDNDLTPSELESVYSQLEGLKIDVMSAMSDEIPSMDNLPLAESKDDFIPEAEEEINLDNVDLLEGVGTEDPVRMYLKEIGITHSENSFGLRSKDTHLFR